MSLRNTPERYGSVAKFLHWLIAVLVIMMLLVGVSFNYLPRGNFMGTLMFIHKSTGVTLLGLIIIRLLWRWTNPYPRFPATMKTWEKLAAYSVHFIFYILIIIMPITGIIMSLAAGHNVPFWFFGNIHLAMIPKYKPLKNLMVNWHEYVAWVITAFIVIHTLAALKHHFYDKDNTMKKML